MGDMKTPDFDDLLAAFDIPDATGLDAKEPIQTSHEETQNHPKHDELCLDQSLLDNPAVASLDVPVVSVIVKNTSRHESVEEHQDRHNSGTTLQNGFTAQESHNDSAKERDNCFSKSFVSTSNDESSPEIPKEVPNQCNAGQAPIFSPSHLNSVSSPEPENPLTNKDETLPIQDRNDLEAPVLDGSSLPNNEQKFDLSLFDNCSQDVQGSRAEIGKSSPPADSSTNSETNKASEEEITFPHLHSNQNLTKTNCNTNTVNVTDPNLAAKSHTSKLFPSFEALVALNATKDPKELTNSNLLPEIQNDLIKASPKVPISPKSPRSPFEAVKRVIKPSDSPVSICSDGSDRASIAGVSGLSPAIPKVRIKTIKTTSGQIKRTVTSVLPESETDDIYSAYESSPSQSVISEDSFSVSPHQFQTNEHVVGIKSKSSPASRTSLKALDRKSEQNTRKSLASCNSSVVKRSATHQVQKPKRTSSAASQKANTTSLPKAVHLASLNLVPHSVAASVAARSTSHQQSNPTLSSSVCSGVPLVHQVKAANPYPCTPVPNTAAGTLHRLLNSANPVPTYVPNLSPPPESNIILPPNGYCCLECGDAFGLEKSLLGHYGRRSVHIEVGCTHCAKTMVFFNKCALLAHAREHKNSGVVMQCTQLHLKPISEEHMLAPLSSEPVNLASCTSPIISSKRSEPVLPLYPDDVVRRSHHCVECNKQLHDHKELAGHYQKLSEDVEGLVCKVCSMLLPNKCSMRAHQRLHANKSPYSCPECGGLSRSADIQKHVKENCLHYARKAWYKCLHCDMVFRTLQGQETHIEEKHCEVFYKCNVCPVGFKTSDACEVHLKKKHSASKSAIQLVLKCSCEAVFKKKRLLFQHFHQNANKRLICVFKCPECNSVFPQKRLLMLHFKSVHVGNVTAEVDNEAKEKEAANLHPDVHSAEQSKSTDAPKFTRSGRKKSEKDIKPRMKPSGWTCGECLQWFSDRESYVSHAKTTHGKSMKKYPCRHCEQSFNSAITLRRHIRSEHDGKRRIYSCWYCTDTKTIFTTSVMLKNHISLMHGIKNPDLSQMPKASLREYKKPLGKKFASDLPSVETQANHLTEAPSAKRPKTQHRCLKCGFTTDDRTDFQQHIPQHRTDESTPQCPHCGLCFTSALSLNRHLFIVHKVKEEEEEEKAGVGTEKQNHRHRGSNKSKPSLDDGSKSAKGTKTTDGRLKPNPALDTRERSLGEEPPP